MNSYLFLLDGAIFTQVCGTQGTSVFKKKEVVKTMKNWKESSVTKMEANPLQNVRVYILIIFQ